MSSSISRILSNNGNVTGNEVDWPGGRGTFMASASNWNGGNVRLQYKMPNGTWVDVDSTSAMFTANNICGFELPIGGIRVLVSGTITGLAVYALGVE